MMQIIRFNESRRLLRRGGLCRAAACRRCRAHGGRHSRPRSHALPRSDGSRRCRGRHRPAAGCRTPTRLRDGYARSGTRRWACGTAASGAHRAASPPANTAGTHRRRGGRRGTRMLTPSASARFGSRAHMPRRVNSGTWSVISRKPVPAPVARLPGQLRPLPAMHSSRPRKSSRKSAVSFRRPRCSCRPGCTSSPSVGCAPHSAPVSSYWIGS